jgi:hypothetical protein
MTSPYTLAGAPETLLARGFSAPKICEFSGDLLGGAIWSPNECTVINNVMPGEWLVHATVDGRGIYACKVGADQSADWWSDEDEMINIYTHIGLIMFKHVGILDETIDIDGDEYEMSDIIFERTLMRGSSVTIPPQSDNEPHAYGFAVRCGDDLTSRVNGAPLDDLTPRVNGAPLDDFESPQLTASVAYRKNTTNDVVAIWLEAVKNDC